MLQAATPKPKYGSARVWDGNIPASTCAVNGDAQYVLERLVLLVITLYG